MEVCMLCNEKKYLVNKADNLNVVNKITELEDLVEYNRENVLTLEKGTKEINNSKNYNIINELVTEEKLKLLEQLTKKRDELYLIASMKSVDVETNRNQLDLLLSTKEQLDVQVNTQRLIKEVFENEIIHSTKVLSEIRYQEAIEIFVMMRIIPERGYENRELFPSIEKINYNSKITLTGVSTISGFPLPNNGKFDGVPVLIVTTALTHISHLVDCLSTILNIYLPHKIIPFSDNYCSTISTQFTVMDDERRRSQSLSQAIYRSNKNKPNDVIHESMKSLDQKFQTIRQNNTNNSNISNILPWKFIPNFKTSLDLLKANIIVLCLKAGLQPEALFPPQAMLLNLYQLYRFCLHKVTTSNIVNESNFAMPNQNTKIYNIIHNKYQMNSSSTNDNDILFIDSSKESDWAIVEVDENIKY